MLSTVYGGFYFKWGVVSMGALTYKHLLSKLKPAIVTPLYKSEPELEGEVFRQVGIIGVINNPAGNLDLKLSYHALILPGFNSGTACAYTLGIKKAMEDGFKTFFLLDDDAVVDQNAFIKMLRIWLKLKERFGTFALSALRVDRPEYIKLLKEPYEELVLGPTDSFFGYNLFHKGRTPLKKGPLEGSFLIPVAPYGGLFLDREFVKQVGYPDASFFMYYDDSEWTYRATKKGIPIILVPSVKVGDLENETTAFIGRKEFFRKVAAQKLYYIVRNEIFFDLRHRVKHWWRFLINVWLISGYFVFFNLTYPRRIFVYFKALLHGFLRRSKEKQRLEACSR